APTSATPATTARTIQGVAELPDEESFATGAVVVVVVGASFGMGSILPPHAWIARGVATNQCSFETSAPGPTTWGGRPTQAFFPCDAQSAWNVYLPTFLVIWPLAALAWYVIVSCAKNLQTGSAAGGVA